MQWTKYGISGIAVFQLSRYVAAEKGAMTFQVTLDLLKPCLEEQKMERAVLQEMLWSVPDSFRLNPSECCCVGF